MIYFVQQWETVQGGIHVREERKKMMTHTHLDEEKASVGWA